jgi:hypothetical protein
MNRLPQITVIATLMVIGAGAWAQPPTASGLPRTAPQEQGSQLLPEAQPPFSPASDRPTVAPPKAAQANDKFPAPRSSVAAEGVGVGSDSPARSSQCDLSLCASTYRSFRALDCTYQPYTGGPRRICER